MNKYDPNKKTKNLDFEIHKAQLDNFDRAMKKSIKSDIIRACLTITPVIVTVIAYTITKSPIALSVGCVVTSVTVIATKLTQDMKINKKKNKNRSSIHVLGDETSGSSNELDRTNERDITPSYVRFEDYVNLDKGTEEYYTDELKDAILYNEEYEKNMPEDERKYNEAAKLQAEQRKNNSRITLANQDDYLQKDDAIKQLVSDIDVYLKTLEHPPLRISDYEWDGFYDAVYTAVKNHNMVKGYYDVMTRLTRLTFADALVNKRPVINIDSYRRCVQELKDLGYDDKFVDELTNLLSSSISEHKTNCKVISIADYVQNQKRR